MKKAIMNALALLAVILIRHIRGTPVFTASEIFANAGKAFKGAPEFSGNAGKAVHDINNFADFTHDARGGIVPELEPGGKGGPDALHLQKRPLPEDNPSSVISKQEPPKKKVRFSIETIAKEKPEHETPPPTAIPKAFSQFSPSFKEWWLKSASYRMLNFIAKHGPVDVRKWAETSESVQRATQWKKKETWLGYVLTNKMYVVPRWRRIYPNTAFGEGGLSGKISKGWNNVFGNNLKTKKAIETALGLPFFPLIKSLQALSSGIEKINSAMAIKMVNWLKTNAPPEIRNTMPNFGIRGETHNPLMPDAIIDHPSSTSE